MWKQSVSRRDSNLWHFLDLGFHFHFLTTSPQVKKNLFSPLLLSKIIIYKPHFAIILLSAFFKVAKLLDHSDFRDHSTLLLHQNWTQLHSQSHEITPNHSNPSNNPKTSDQNNTWLEKRFCNSCPTTPLPTTTPITTLQYHNSKKFVSKVVVLIVCVSFSCVFLTMNHFFWLLPLHFTWITRWEWWFGGGSRIVYVCIHCIHFMVASISSTSPPNCSKTVKNAQNHEKWLFSPRITSCTAHTWS